MALYTIIAEIVCVLLFVCVSYKVLQIDPLICMYSSWFIEPVASIYDTNTKASANVLVVSDQLLLIHGTSPHKL